MPNLNAKRVGHTLDPLLFGLYRDQTRRLSLDIGLRFAETVGDWLSTRQHGLAVTMNRLCDVLSESDDEDRPSIAATQTTADLIRAAYSRMSNYFPRGWVTVTPHQGLHLAWLKGGRHVRVFVPGDPGVRGYVYHEEGSVFQTEELSAEALAARLDWLLNA